MQWICGATMPSAQWKPDPSILCSFRMRYSRKASVGDIFVEQDTVLSALAIATAGAIARFIEHHLRWALSSRCKQFRAQSIPRCLSRNSGCDRLPTRLDVASYCNSIAHSKASLESVRGTSEFTSDPMVLGGNQRIWKTKTVLLYWK